MRILWHSNAPWSPSGYGRQVALFAPRLSAHAELAISAFGGLRDGLVLTLLDVPALDPATWSRLNVACWVPVDHDPAPHAVRSFFAQTGAIPIAMSRFAHERLSGVDALYVPHGVDTAVFSPRPQAEARQRVGLPRSAFVVGAVAMNKGYPSRKSLPQIVEAFAAFRARHGEALLYLHTEVTGLYNEGYDLRPLLL